MSWPLSHDYNRAVQVPRLAFADPDLKGGTAAAGANGLPLPRTGNFADVYEVRAPDGRPWAVKCFTRPVVGLDRRYAAVADALAAADLPFTVGFTFLGEGVRVGGTWFPAVKMEWVEGLLVNQFVRENADKPAALDGLLKLWVRLCKRLREAGVAHGDLQHGNVLLVPGSKPGAVVLKLIDYDGMYVPTLANNPSGESGHPAFQHPARASTRAYSPDVDRFPHLVVAAALAGLKVLGADLWHRYDTGDNLLFTEADFRDPAGSRVMRELWGTNDADARALVGNLALACLRPIPQTAWLDHIAPDGRPILLPPDWRHAAATALGLSLPVSVESTPPQNPSPPDAAFTLEPPASEPRRAYPVNPFAVGAAVAAVGAAVVALVLLAGTGAKTVQNAPHDDDPKAAPADGDPVPPAPVQEPPKAVPAVKPPVQAVAVRPVAPAPRAVAPPDEAPDVIPLPRAVERRPVPPADAQAAAEAKIRAALKDDYARKTPAERRALARKLVALAEGTTDDPPARYVLLRDARDFAAAAGDPAAAVLAIDGLGRWFAVEADALKLAALEQIVAAPPVPAVLRAVADIALPASDAAADADDSDGAVKFADLAARAAKKGTLGPAAVEDGEFRVGQAKAAREAFAVVKPAADVLKADPDDPAANLAVGKYRCFAQARWDVGLPHLAKCSDARLKAVAGRDLDEPRAGVADVKLADAWWDYARAAPDAEKRAADARARYWYARAAAGLTGLPRAQAESRLGFTLGAAEFRPGLLAEFATRPPAGPKTPKPRIDGAVEFSNESFTDLPKKGVELHVKWRGVVVAPRPGRYRLVVTAADPVRVTVGGKVVIDTVAARGGAKDATVTLTDRPAALVVELHTVPPEQRPNPRRLKLGWAPPGGPAEDVIPPEYLFHDRKTAAAVPP